MLSFAQELVDVQTCLAVTPVLLFFPSFVLLQNHGDHHVFGVDFEIAEDLGLDRASWCSLSFMTLWSGFVFCAFPCAGMDCFSLASFWRSPACKRKCSRCLALSLVKQNVVWILSTIAAIRPDLNHCHVSFRRQLV